MSNEDVTLTIGGNAEGAEAATKKAGDALTGYAKKVESTSDVLSTKAASAAQVFSKKLDDVGEAGKRSNASGALFDATLGKLVASFTAVAIIDRGIGLLTDWGREAIASAGKTVDLANKTGLSTETIQRMAHASQQTGASLEGLGNSAVQLGLRAANGSKKAERAAADLGLEWDKLRTMRLDEMFALVMERLEGVESVTDRNRIAAALFGPASKEATQAAADGYTKLTREINVTKDAQVRALDAAVDAWTRFKSQATRSIQGVLGTALTAMQALERGADSMSTKDKAWLFLTKGATTYVDTLRETGRQLIAVDEAENKRTATVTTARASTETHVEALKKQTNAVAALTTAQRHELLAADQLGQVTDDLLATYNLTSAGLQLLKTETDKKASSDKQAAEASGRFAKEMRELATSIDIAASTMEKQAFLEKFGKKANDAVIAAKAVKGGLDALPASIRAVAAEFGKVELAKAMEAIRTNTQEIAFKLEADERAHQRRLADVKNDGIAKNFELFTAASKELERFNREAMMTRLGFELDEMRRAGEERKKQYTQDLGDFAAYVATVDALTAAALNKRRYQEDDETADDAFNGLIPPKVVLTQLSEMGRQLPQVIAQAFTSGGGWQGALLGSASTMGSSALASIFGAPGSKTGLLKNMNGILGEMLGSAMPVIGSLIGPALKGLGKLFGVGINDEVRKANGEIDKVKEKLLETHGPMDVLEAKARAVGLSFEANWGQQGQAGLKAFNALVAEFEQRWKALNQELADTRTALTGAIGEAKQLGYEFDATGKLTGVSVEAMRSTAQRFGLDLQALGPQFEAAQLRERMTDVINGFTLMDVGGTQTGTILAGLKDEINAIVIDSIKFGVDIPANMRPWIQNLIETGQLTDENGEKMTDLTRLKFGEPVATEFEKITAKISTLIDAIAVLVERINSTITPAIDRATQDRNIRIGFTYDEPPTFGLGAFPGHAKGYVGSRPHLAMVSEGGRAEIIGDVDFMQRALAGAMQQMGLIERTVSASSRTMGPSLAVASSSASRSITVGDIHVSVSTDSLNDPSSIRELARAIKGAFEEDLSLKVAVGVRT